MLGCFFAKLKTPVPVSYYLLAVFAIADFSLYMGLVIGFPFRLRYLLGMPAPLSFRYCAYMAGLGLAKCGAFRQPKPSKLTIPAYANLLALLTG